MTKYSAAKIRGYSPSFKTARAAKNISRIINTIAWIWCKNMLTVFLKLRSRKTVRFEYVQIPTIFVLSAAKSFWSPFKMKVQDTDQQHLTLLKDWELLIPSWQALEDHTLLLVTQGLTNHPGLLSNKQTVARDLVRSL